MSYGIGEAPENRTVNGFFCTGCDTLLLSLYTHDYKVCECGNMVDGGSSYVRRGFKDFEAFRKVVEIFDWAGIIVAAEIGLSQQLSEFVGESEFMRDDGIKQLIEQERLIFATDAEEPKGEQELGLTVIGAGDDDPDEEVYAAAQVEKEARDRARAAELFSRVRDLSLGGENN